MLVEGADVAPGLDGPSRAGFEPGGERRQGRAVQRGLGRGEDRAAVLVQQVDGRRPRRPEPVVGSGGDQVDIQASAAPAEIGIAPGYARPRSPSPAVVAAAVGCEVEAPGAPGGAVFHRALDLAEASALQARRAARMVGACLHPEADRSSQRVQPERRITGDEVRPGDGGLRDQVPVDGVPEGLVEPDAAHVDRDPLRRALQGGSREAPEVQALQEAVSLGVGRAGPGDALGEGVGHRQRAAAPEVIRRKRLDGRREPVRIDAGARRGRGRDHVEGADFARRSGLRGARAGIQAGERQRRRAGKRLKSRQINQPQGHVRP